MAGNIILVEIMGNLYLPKALRFQSLQRQVITVHSITLKKIFDEYQTLA